VESEMRDIAPLLRRGWIYKAAVEEVAGRLHPDAQIRALHSRAVTAGKDYQRELDFVYADIPSWKMHCRISRMVTRLLSERKSSSDEL
jgi:hypothetical protein